MQTSDVTSTIVNLVTSNLYSKPWAAARRQKAFKTIAGALMRHAYDTTQFNWTEVRSDMELLAHDIIEENTLKKKGGDNSALHPSSTNFERNL